MSIEREVPKDISRYEAKAIGPFTTRQLLCGIPAVSLAIGSYFLLKSYVSQDVVFFVAFVVAMPLFLLGWAKPYGIPLEKYLSIVFVSQILAPKHRKYVTENTYQIPNDINEQKIKNPKKKKQKQKIYTGEYQRYL